MSVAGLSNITHSTSFLTSYGCFNLQLLKSLHFFDEQTCSPVTPVDSRNTGQKLEALVLSNVGHLFAQFILLFERTYMIKSSLDSWILSYVSFLFFLLLKFIFSSHKSTFYKVEIIIILVRNFLFRSVPKQLKMMSSLKQQLQSIKENQNVLKIGPNQQQPSILFDKYTARTTSIDTIYSMSILAYDKLSSHFSNALEQVHNREELLSENMKEINRNTLTKEQNAQLSRKLEKFIIELAPFLLNAECQHILQYLLRNFKVNVFETQTLVLALLPYWNYEIYQKIIANVSKRQMTGKLTFLNQMISNEQINFSFILKTLTFSHAILDKLISIVLEGSLLEVKTSKDVVIRMDNQNDERFLRHSLKNFLLKVFLTLIKEKKTSHYKYIIDFCTSCLRIKYPHNAGDQKFELIASVLILLSNLVIQNGISDQYLSRTVKKLLTKFTENQESLISEKSLKLIFDFVMIIWQRKTTLIDKQIIELLSKNKDFLKYLKNFTASKYMIFYHLWNFLCFEGAQCQALLAVLGVSIKTEQFFKSHENNFMGFIFEALVRAQNDSKISTKQFQWIYLFIKTNFKHELAVWINQERKSGRSPSSDLIKVIFENSEIDHKNQLILHQNIQRIMPDKKVQQNKSSLGIQRVRIQQEKDESEDEQGQAKQSKKGKKLIEFLRKKGIQVENQIDFENQQTKKTLIELFQQAYNDQATQKIGIHQKILIVQKYGNQVPYSPSQFEKDVQSSQYSISIKRFSASEDKNQDQTVELFQEQIRFIEIIFSFILAKKEELENIVFKQLLRLVLNKLLQVTAIKYKKGIEIIHKFYKKLLNGCNGCLDYVQANNLILKISEKVFTSVGNTKGKYQNLIHCHCKLFALLINNIDSHEFNEQSPIITHELLQKTYHQIISIFGSKQLYLINTGIIELITRKQLNYKKLKYFIEEIMVRELNYELQTQKQSEINVNYYEHALSIGKSLIFGSFMLGSGEQQWINSISPILTSGIARNQVAIFYGLVKDKLKRNVVRKLFLFFKLTYESKRFVEGFKNYLTTINDKQMFKLLHIYSQIYYILLSINFGNDQKIQSVIQKLLDNITNLFSLDLRLTLFKPLLPNIKLYSYLNSQFQLHRQANFEELAQLANIVPDEPSIEWVDFIKQCLKRGHKLSSATAQSIFTNEHFLNDDSNFQTYCELACHLSQYDKEALVPYISQSMNIIMAMCQMQANQDYCISILYRIIINMKELIDPFVGQIYSFVLENGSEFVQKFISDTVEGLTVPTLIETVKNIVKKTKHLYHCGLFFKYVCKNGVGHLLVKTLQYYASKIIHSSVQDQVDLENLYDLTAEIFLQMTLKFNQNQLRKVLIDMVRWSEVKQSEQIAIPFNMRKIIISSIFSKLSSNLGSLFTPFYGYIFDSWLKDLDEIVKARKERSKELKRQRTESNFSDSVTVIYIGKVLESLSSLFTNDSEKQFLDGTKFDILSERLSNLFTVDKLDYESYITMTNSLSSCLLKLCNYLTDDYQLKSLNLKILLLLRLNQSHIHEAIFQFMDKLIDEIQDRYLLFINDLVPFLIDNIHNRNEKVKAPIKSIINKFEDMSGAKIENYMSK